MDNGKTKVPLTHYVVLGAKDGALVHVEEIWRIYGSFVWGKIGNSHDQEERWEGRVCGTVIASMSRIIRCLGLIVGLVIFFIATLGQASHGRVLLSEGSDVPERKTAAGFLISVALMQVVASIVWVVEVGPGQVGQMGCYIAFWLSIIHQLFAGIVVPGSLLWAAWAVLAKQKSLDALLAAIVGTLWYGPDQVQHALQRITWIVPRYQVLKSALGSYHRSAVHCGVHYEPLSKPLRVRRKLRKLPWWSRTERGYKKWWNGRVVLVDKDEVIIVDAELREVARVGATLALTGNINEERLRRWWASMVADQARFPLSPSSSIKMHEYPEYVFSGSEGRKLKMTLDENGRDWSHVDYARLATVVDNMRRRGIKHLRDRHWLE